MTRHRNSAALSVVLVHIFLVAALGQYYAKAQVPLGIAELYPTEIAVIVMTIIGWPFIRRVPFDRLTKLVVAFLLFGVAWVVIAGVGGMAGAGAKALSFFVYSSFYFVLRGATASSDARMSAYRVLGTASVFAALLGFVHMQRGAPLFPGADFEETTTGSIRWLPGEFALYALIGAMIVAVDAIIRRRLTQRGAVVLAAAAAELILAQHRSGFVALVIALIATAGFLGGSQQALKGLLKLLVIALIGFAVFMWLFGSTYLNETMDRIAHTGDMSDVNIEWRLLCWYEVVDGIVARPFGHGFAVWDFLFTQDDPLTGSHNSFLDLTYRIGIPGFVVFAAIPVELFRRTRAIVQRLGPTRVIDAIIACACILSLLVYASFNVVLETPHMSIFFWVLLGVGAASLDDAQVAVEQASNH